MFAVAKRPLVLFSIGSRLTDRLVSEFFCFLLCFRQSFTSLLSRSIVTDAVQFLTWQETTASLLGNVRKTNEMGFSRSCTHSVGRLPRFVMRSMAHRNPFRAAKNMQKQSMSTRVHQRDVVLSSIAITSDERESNRTVAFDFVRARRFTIVLRIVNNERLA